MKRFITYYFYPLLLLAHIIICYLIIIEDYSKGAMFSWFAGSRMVILLAVEFGFPMKKGWKMTWASFYRDLKYAGVGIILFQGMNFLLGLLLIYWSKDNTGLLANTSILTGFILTALFFEFFQYWHHRLSHEMKGKFGNFLWKTHAAHHLPERVYLLMHAVGHPINAIITFIIIQGSLILMGARQESIFLLQVFMGLQGLVSHFNVKIKAGFLNYIFIGTELHRSHHSANIEEAKNYGAFLSIWDLIFGTFYYNPDKEPERLGVVDPENYPRSTEILKVMALPFVSQEEKAEYSYHSEKNIPQPPPS